MNRNIASSIHSGCGNGPVFLAALLIAACTACSARGDVQNFVVSLSGEKRLDIYSLDGEGEFSLQSKTSLKNAPGTSRFDHTGRNLYVGTTKPGQICVFRVNPDGLTKLQSVDVPAKPSCLAVSPNGQFLIAAYYSTGQVTVHRILGVGRLSIEPLQTITTAPNAHGVAIDPTGKYVFVPHTKPNAIYQFRMDAVTGRLSANDPPLLQRDANTGPRHLGFHPDAKYAYGSNEQGRSISQYSFDSETGLLSHLQTLSSVPDDFTGNATTSEVVVHPSGRFAYISNRGHGTIAVFEIDDSTGKLKLLQRVPSSEAVRSFSVSTDGLFLVAACQQTGVLISYKIATDGKLKQVAKRYVGKRPWWVSFPSSTLASKRPTRVSNPSRPQDRTLTLGQGTMSGEVTESTILLQTRLTQGTALRLGLP